MSRFYRLRTKAVLYGLAVFLLFVLLSLFFRTLNINFYGGFSNNNDGIKAEYTLDMSKDKTSLSQKSQHLGDLTILMYHNVLKKDKKESVYCINENSLREDFEYLKKNGYKVIDFKTLLKSVDNASLLPEKAVIITFDDGYLNNVKYALPLLKEYDYSALFSVVGSYTLLNSSNPLVGGDFVYLDWNEIAKLSNEENVEIGLHSYDFHELRPRLGVSQLNGESDEEYKKIFEEDTEKLLKALKKSGVKSGYEKIYTYPFGKYNKISESVLKEKGVKITLTCNEGINHIKAYDELYLLKRLNRDATKNSLKEILAKYE